ncbi:hypothetical protein M409DRAFT_20472 [Zasmidium cellare ATCC 36951]|uniref:F-box domain-containing protein n=1 Tax=Zasmidium cellare ATCC 36951 TaxID=1080233 RepID=A0A6A6CST7_ZASCE|nr:uncharacterized protein M409DRAFT_20472 [Zasmidium cellare ATCC 36951]KAF2169248.1 hypothetical protein M409DRAFT_20472 [Zasmidium cellare ATCC 36951]
MKRRSFRLAVKSIRLAIKSGDPESDATAALASPFKGSPTVDTSTNDKKDEPPFRLLDLPPEVRNRVYSYALVTPLARDLSYFTLPPLSLTSRQIRHETLPILFVESPFRLIIGSNIDHQHLTFFHEEQRSHRSSGIAGIKRTVSSALKTAGEAGLFRDVKLEVYNALYVESVRVWNRRGRQSSGSGTLRARDDDKLQIASLHLHVVEGSLKLAVEEGPDYPSSSRLSHLREHEVNQMAVALDGALENASYISRNFGAQDGFKGFKLSHLRKIAMAFRLG